MFIRVCPQQPCQKDTGRKHAKKHELLDEDIETYGAALDDRVPGHALRLNDDVAPKLLATVVAAAAEHDLVGVE